MPELRLYPLTRPVMRTKERSYPVQLYGIFYWRKDMKASVAIQVLPQVDSEDELIRIVDEVVAYIKSTGLNCYVGPFETTIEGESYDELMEIVSNCQKVAIKAGCPSVSSYIKVVYNPEGEVLTIDKKVSKHHK